MANNPSTGRDPYGEQGYFETAVDFWANKLGINTAPPPRPSWWNKPGGFNQSGANTLSPQPTAPPPPVPTEVIGEDDFLKEVDRVKGLIDTDHNKGKAYWEIAAIIDSKYLKSKNKFDKVCFRGRIMTKAEINYYFQGMVWALQGISHSQMFSIIAGYKANKMEGDPDYRPPSKDEIWAAEMGFNNYERDLREAARRAKGSNKCPPESIIMPPDDPTAGSWRQWILLRGRTVWKWVGQGVGVL